MKRQLIYFCLSAICFTVCVLIVAFFDYSPFIRGFIGDIIIILLLYFLVKGFHEFNPSRLALAILILAYITEFTQYLKLATLLGLETNALARLIIGSVFDKYDLIAYTIGSVIVYFMDTQLLIKLYDTRRS